MGIDLVIFDCDGVLVDSERLAVRIEASVLAQLGWPLSPAEIVRRFVGRSASHMHHEIERHLGRTIDWDAQFETRYRDTFATELTAVPGVLAALARIERPIYVASSGTHDKIRTNLALTGLLGHFEGRIFSAQDVERAKPAPDLFLFAARECGVDPSRCVVIEDSVAGVVAGCAAEMRVLGYSGSVTSALALSEHGAVVFDVMDELPALLDEIESKCPNV